MKTDKMLPKMLEDSGVLTGYVCAQRVRCGRANCRCETGGAKLHGPYFYHFWRENGRLKKRYLKPGEVTATRAACERGKLERKRRAVWRRAFRAGNNRTFAALMRETQGMIRSANHGR